MAGLMRADDHRCGGAMSMKPFVIEMIGMYASPHNV